MRALKTRESTSRRTDDLSHLYVTKKAMQAMFEPKEGEKSLVIIEVTRILEGHPATHYLPLRPSISKIDSISIKVNSVRIQDSRNGALILACNLPEQGK